MSSEPRIGVVQFSRHPPFHLARTGASCGVRELAPAVAARRARACCLAFPFCEQCVAVLLRLIQLPGFSHCTVIVIGNVRCTFACPATATDAVTITV